MARLIDGDTDLEMTRYNEAAQIKQYSGLSPTTVRGGMTRYDPITKSDAVYVDLPSGGNLRIGDRPVQMAQADTLTTRTDATAAAPAPAATTAAPTARQPIAQYDAEFRSTSNRAPTAADFEAGGYSPQEIATLNPDLEKMPVKLTTDQMAEYAQQPGAEMVRPEPPGFFDGTISETIKGLVRGGIVDPAKFVNETLRGDTSRILFQLVDPQTGEFDPQIKIVSAQEIADMEKMPYGPVSLEELLKPSEQSGTGAQIAGGVGQFVGAFAGVGKLFKVGKGLLGATTQGAAADFLGFEGNEGRLADLLLELGVPENSVTNFLRTDPNDPDYLGRFKNALEGAVLGGLVDQIAPVFRLLKEGGSKTELGQALGDLRFKAQQTSANLLSDAIGAGRAIAAGDTRMLGEVFQPAGTPRSLGAGAVDTSYRMQQQPRGPESELPIRLDDVTKSTTGENAGYPEDFYSSAGPRIYAPGPQFKDDEFGRSNQESYNIIKSVKGKPDAEVTIYRAVPNDPKITAINRGDFVTLSPTYAKLHGASGYGPKGEDAGKILSEKVKVKDIYFDGNDVNEFGYFPEKAATQGGVGKDILALNLKAQPKLAKLFKNAEVTADSPIDEISSTLLRAERSGIIDRRTADEIVNSMKGQ